MSDIEGLDLTPWSIAFFFLGLGLLACEPRSNGASSSKLDHANRIANAANGDSTGDSYKFDLWEFWFMPDNLLSGSDYTSSPVGFDWTLEVKSTITTLHTCSSHRDIDDFSWSGQVQYCEFDNLPVLHPSAISGLDFDANMHLAPGGSNAENEDPNPAEVVVGGDIGVYEDNVNCDGESHIEISATPTGKTELGLHYRCYPPTHRGACVRRGSLN